ncbi:hypothetical protein [Dyella sp. 2RAB6]|uniref:hypothetical protein n=1 Tax=Dyella sp. 2RAB6 TaxID=3232992 RepID=UPI003F930E23
MALTIIFAVAGCASTPPTVEMEPSSIARKLGVPSCRVSVPLSQSEVIQDAKRMGNPRPESHPEWSGMIASIRLGDQLRLVDCLRASRSARVDDLYYYALIRDDRIVSAFHFIVIN